MTVTGTALATAATNAAASAGATAVFKAAIDRVEKTLKGPARALGIKALASLHGYSAYLRETNERVSTFKTFADPTKPVSLLDHFVETRFENKRGRKPLNQDALLAKISKPARLVVSATAGFGKSMVMRYFALALYENPAGKIPIFLELRNLNRVSSPDIISFINGSYRQSTDIQVETFRQGLQSGIFVLILDGFDELNHDIRPIIEDQILSIARNYPLISIVVSGRPDDRFKSWRDFTLYRVLPMEQAQVIELINKLEYDNGVRKRFIQKIRTGLFISHQSFMSTPLLSILMLLTFEQNANIPDKMHLFYAEAFRTLFHKHDALKEQYDRSRKSGLTVDEFEKVFSVFCLKTYVLEKLEFTSSEITKNISDAINYSGQTSAASEFLFDIEEAVCLIVKEGNSYFFVHRSFQEYFTALFLANCSEAVRDNFINQVSNRYWDSVLPMLFDMASEQIIPTWVKTNTDKYLSAVGHGPGKIPPLSARFTKVLFMRRGDVTEFANFEFGTHWRYLAVMMRFYPQIGSHSRLDWKPLEQWAQQNRRRYEASGMEGRTEDGQKIELVTIAIEDFPEDVIAVTGLSEIANAEYEQVLNVSSTLNGEQKAKNDFLFELFHNQAE